MRADPFPIPMRSRGWRAFVERMIPWYDPEQEDAHNRETEAVRQRAIAQRIRVERVIDDYRKVEARARRTPR